MVRSADVRCSQALVVIAKLYGLYVLGCDAYAWQLLLTVVDVVGYGSIAVGDINYRATLLLLHTCAILVLGYRSGLKSKRCGG